MKKETKKIILNLSNQVCFLDQPIHLLAVCTGGTKIAKIIKTDLNKRNIKSNVFEMWTDITNGKKILRKTNFKKNDYIGTAVIIDDVIWNGTAIPCIKKYLKKLKRKKIYIAALFDVNKKADFAVYR